jgi:hypothetical protein
MGGRLVPSPAHYECDFSDEALVLASHRKEGISGDLEVPIDDFRIRLDQIQQCLRV